MAMLWRLLGAAQYDQPTHAVAAFDSSGPTFRHELFPAYKNNRPARDEELAPQIPYITNAVEAMGLHPVRCEGFEADDVIATLARKAVEAGMRVTIVSSDKDMAQLVRDGAVEVIDPVAHVRWNEAYVAGVKFGVRPDQVTDFQAIAGDSVDNIPGMEGIGPKHGAAYVRLFGTVEEIIAATRTAPSFFTPGHRARLKEDGVMERLQLYRELARLRTDVPLAGFNFEMAVLQPIMREHVDRMLKTLEATGRFESIFVGTPQMSRVVDPIPSMEDETDWWNEELMVPGQPVPDLPQCGYYERRLHKHGVFVPAVIYREREMDLVTGEPTGQDILRCIVGDSQADPILEWPRLFRYPISQTKYQFEMADARWAKAYSPDDPKANPTAAVDFLALKAPTFNQSASQKRKIVR